LLPSELLRAYVCVTGDKLLPAIKGKAINRAVQELKFNGFPYGLNTIQDGRRLLPGELTACLNFKYGDSGQLISRPGIVEVSSNTTDSAAAITAIVSGQLAAVGALFDDPAYLFDVATFGAAGSEAYANKIVVADSNNKIYSLEGTVLSPIATNYTAEGTVYLCSFDGKVIIFDGSYIKYWDGLNFNICYDNGSGLSSYMYNNSTTTSTGTASLYTGATVKYGVEFTVPTLPSGMTMPITKASFVLSKSGSPTGTAVVELFPHSSPTTALATSGTLDVSTLTTSAAVTNFIFAEPYYPLTQGAKYILVVSYSGGGVSDYVKVSYASGSTCNYNDGTWKTASTAPMCKIGPGLPPKATFGCVWQNRLWAVDSQKPGWVRFSNASSPYDWSTADGGGYIGSIDDSGFNFPIGAIIAYYGDLYLIGRKESPYISRITGRTPTAFVQDVLLQKIYATQNNVVSTSNDIWVANNTGVYSIRGVQEHGDIRTNSPGEPIQNLLEQYHTDASFCGYDPSGGQFYLNMVGIGDFEVCHTRRPSRLGDNVRYPWTQYRFGRSIYPSAFAFCSRVFYIGGVDGKLYSLTSDQYDCGEQPAYQVRSSIIENPSNNMLVTNYYISVDTSIGGGAYLHLMKDGAAYTDYTIQKTLTADDSALSGKLLFQCRSLQWELYAISSTDPVMLNNVSFLYTPMEAKK
jgi:hypothetical protein